MKFDPAKTVLKYRVGDEIKPNEADFLRFSSTSLPKLGVNTCKVRWLDPFTISWELQSGTRRAWGDRYRCKRETAGALHPSELRLVHRGPQDYGTDEVSLPRFCELC